MKTDASTDQANAERIELPGAVKSALAMHEQAVVSYRYSDGGPSSERRLMRSRRQLETSIAAALTPDPVTMEEIKGLVDKLENSIYQYFCGGSPANEKRMAEARAALLAKYEDLIHINRK